MWKAIYVKRSFKSPQLKAGQSDSSSLLGRQHAWRKCFTAKQTPAN